MEFVQPIREKKQIEAMKRQLRGNDTGLRDLCLFVLGINSGGTGPIVKARTSR